MNELESHRYQKALDKAWSNKSSSIDRQWSSIYDDIYQDEFIKPLDKLNDLDAQRLKSSNKYNFSKDTFNNMRPEIERSMSLEEKIKTRPLFEQEWRYSNRPTIQGYIGTGTTPNMEMGVPTQTIRGSILDLLMIEGLKNSLNIDPVGEGSDVVPGELPILRRKLMMNEIGK